MTRDRGPAVVVGGGIAGLAAALELARAGIATTVVDPGASGGSATPAAAGLLAPLFETDPAGPLFPLLLAARRAYGSFVRELELVSRTDVDYREDGLLLANLSAHESADSARAAARFRNLDLRAEVLEPGEARRLVRGLGEVHSAAWLPDEAAVDPARLAPALARAAAAAGVRTVRARARRLRTEGGRAVGVAVSPEESLPAELVVLASGAWPGPLAAASGGEPLVRPVRGQMLRVSPAHELERPVADHRGCYALPRADGSAVLGSTMEEAGYEVRTTAEGIAFIRSRAALWLPTLAASEPREAWAGLRPFSPDGLPLIGRHPAVEGVLLAMGYGRNGILIAPEAARLLVARALGKPAASAAEVSLAPFDPARFCD